jgi:hypothetical protein
MNVIMEGPRTRVREVWSPRKAGEYATPSAALDEVKEWYWRVEERRGARPSGYEVVEQRADGEWQVLVLQNLRDEFCVEVRVLGSVDDPRAVEVHEVPPATAYQIALDRDERFIARGYTVVNERHPRR